MSKSDLAISIRGISKSYAITKNAERHDTLAETVLHRLRDPFRRQEREIFWALKDVSFDVKKGEVVGIIGRNGAGKSTLLKIMSQITDPTAGEIDIYGRIGSLLEVGTGFHPELSGRENVYLNGQIMGMKRKEIDRQFDAIVDFSGVENFIDTPVKRYSSGMYVRLAFAVAAHLQPEVLIVDEVLAVGDHEFQKKCLGKMHEASEVEGRTVLFVSHNTTAIESLCSRCIYLHSGTVAESGPTRAVVRKYLENIKSRSGTTPISQRRDREGSGVVRFVGFRVTDEAGDSQATLSSGQSYTFRMEYNATDRWDSSRLMVGSIGITDQRGQYVQLLRSNFGNFNFPLPASKGEVQCTVQDFALAPGRYSVDLFLSDGDAETLDFIPAAAEFDVEGGDFFGTGHIGLPSHCSVLTRSQWRAV